jgi:hypothetical protein
MAQKKTKSVVPIALWYLVAVSLMSLGAFFGYVGMRLYEAAHAEASFGTIFLGLVLAVWGFVVLLRCLPRRG